MPSLPLLTSDRIAQVRARMGGSATSIGSAVGTAGRRFPGSGAFTQRPTALRGHRLLSSLLVIAAFVAIALVISLVRSGDTATPVDAQLSPAVVITNLSDGRDGRPFALADGRPLFPLPATTLTAFADKPVEMQSVVVQETVPGVGFWVGEDSAQRVFAVPRAVSAKAAAPIPLPDVSRGQTVNVSGHFRENATSAADAGITDSVQAEQYDRQQYRLEFNSVRAGS